MIKVEKTVTESRMIARIWNRKTGDSYIAVCPEECRSPEEREIWEELLRTGKGYLDRGELSVNRLCFDHWGMRRVTVFDPPPALGSSELAMHGSMAGKRVLRVFVNPENPGYAGAELEDGSITHGNYRDFSETSGVVNIS